MRGIIAERAAEMPDKLLDQRQVKAAEMLVSGHGLKEVCKALNITSIMMYQWRTQHPAFENYIEFLKKEASENFVFSAKQAAQVAIQSLAKRALMGDIHACKEILKIFGIPERLNLSIESDKVQQLLKELGGDD